MKRPPLTPQLIRRGYEMGIFPMADDNDQIDWYEPIDRALFPMKGTTLSRSTRKTWDRGYFRVSYDEAFEQVVRSCRRPEHNWINEEIIQAYVGVANDGWGHSCEVWQNGELVGGTYGIALGGCFCAESMFHRVTNASKIALHSMIIRCADLGFTIFDAEVMNPHLESIGAFEVPQSEFLRMLAEALPMRTIWSNSRSGIF